MNKITFDAKLRLNVRKRIAEYQSHCIYHLQLQLVFVGEDGENFSGL